MTVSFGKCRELNGKEGWMCRTGNLVTVSTVSREKCVRNHLHKLRTVKPAREEIFNIWA